MNKCLKTIIYIKFEIHEFCCRIFLTINQINILPAIAGLMRNVLKSRGNLYFLSTP